ncbi:MULTISPECIES: hypothetical protein [Streptomyces]|uniref:Uncharacterized protein n=1 Tax=Streptomyces cacaoi TaxID=1898 RepID=A0A4Y3R388_STRCI|nr:MULTISPECIES: hypothetical protein [Streptomyces]NNG85592.1 hypothetical protein [Streptomyces cacaoi]QHF97872.1 hypothetical protein DEH18_33055 [Streptomyces sp. NHF165]GEB52002.1 hypothetical protein SCA03_45530 [Streptomyces cacaoi]
MPDKNPGTSGNSGGGNGAWYESNSRISFLIPFLVIGLAYCQISLQGSASTVGMAVFSVALLACVVRTALNVRTARKR